MLRKSAPYTGFNAILPAPAPFKFKSRAGRVMTRRGPASLIAPTNFPFCAVAVLILLAFFGAAAQAAENAPSLLHAVFEDHAVLQRDVPIHVWGHTNPGQEVSVAIADKHAHGRADAHGSWQAILPALPAGGPYDLTASAGDGSAQTIKDVLIGDVWLCSGQSNMVLQVKRTLDSRAEIADAHNDSIRMLTVPEAISPAPLETFATPVPWLPTTPQNVPEFSAACYYFARELQKKIAVPMGLINASWGGARIEAWLSAKALRSIGGYDEALDVLSLYATDPIAGAARWGDIWTAWWRARAGSAHADEPWNPARVDRAGWRVAPQALGGYQQWGVADIADFTGMLWYRTTVTLNAAQAAQNTALAIGSVDEIDETWVNGRLVGSTYGGDAREYKVARGLLHQGDNLIVVNALNTYKDGGLLGPRSALGLHFADGTSVPLTGDWEYRAAPRGYGSPPGAPWTSAYGVTTLYNGMLAPLEHFGIRGVVWYQGESNTSDAGSYRKLLGALRNDLRAHFGADSPLLVAQLASYGKAPTHPEESGSAQLREAQRLAVSEDAHSGLAVTIDIGDRYDIHPANKQELGRRLARAARHVSYGETALPPSGPVPLRARRDRDEVVVTFGDITNGLVAYGADGPVGFELCAAQTDSCRYASAQVRGADVILRAANTTTATRVRYGWADSPVVTLFDGAGLPAGPFELPIPSSDAKNTPAEIK